MNSEVQNFKNEVSQINEYDYGDFMRSANVYLNKLRGDLSYFDDKSINQRIDYIQGYLQFNPNWDIELTRDMLTKDLSYIEELVEGHKQDWESSPN